MLVLLAACLQAPPPDPAVTAKEIEATVRFLASDELAGRATGTPGGDRAAAYLAEALARCGVGPAGDEGNYLQAVPLRRAEAKAPPELVLSAPGAGEKVMAVSGRDFEPPSAAVAVEDLKILVAKGPADIPAKADPGVAILVDAFVGDVKTWFEKAGHPQAAGFGLWIQAGSKTAGEERAFQAGPRGGLARDLPKTASTPTVRVRGPLLERLKKGEFEKITFRSGVEEVRFSAHNVVGRVAGTGGADLAGEAVVVSAHYDHLPSRTRKGTGEAEKKDEDTIYNGADDDASGCAAVLEIAEALAAKKPARTVVFLFATGEEVGLLGTEAYLDHPVVPLERTVANLNIEMIGRPDPMIGGAGRVWLTGYERSDLGPACEQAGLAVQADPRLDEHFFERSDNYAFVMRGVVGQTFSTYNMHGDYHHPSDEADTLDYAHMETSTKAVLGAVRLVADGKLRPRWTEGGAPKHR